MDKYYLALGRFVDMYASIEDSLFVALYARAGVTHETAQAIFSGTRVKAGVSFLRRIHEANSIPLDPRVEEALKQLNSINTFRDDLLHWGTRPGGAEIFTTNAMRTHRNVRKLKVSHELLEDIIADLGTITHVFAIYTIRLSFGEPGFPQPENSQGQKMLQASLAPWRYTPA